MKAIRPLAFLACINGAVALVEGNSQLRRSLIIGGTPTTNLEFPFYVQSKHLTCGGTLVAKDVVLSAAHCVEDFDGDVLVGAWLVNETNGTAAEWRKIVGEMVIHPQYNIGTDQNDYMLFKIEPVTKPGLDPILLNTDPNIPTLGDQFTVIGMGFNSTNYTNADRLLKVQVRYVDHDLCQDQWELLDDDMYYNESKEVFDDSMFCAIGDFSATMGPTKGDSGGPVFDAATNRLLGIVSWGGAYPDKSATPSYPSVFARVSFAAEWMQDIICNMTDDPESQSLYCPYLRCPADEQILGFPQAIIPDRVASVGSNYRLADVLQSPPGGELVNPNSSTLVTITARTASTNANLSCTFRINVGPVEYLGETAFDITSSNVKKKQRKSLGINKYPGAKGCVHIVEMTLNTKLLGRGAKISNQIVIGSKSDKPSTLVAGRTTIKATISPCVDFANTQSLNLSLNSTNVVLPGSTLKRKYAVKVKLYGQKILWRR